MIKKTLTLTLLILMMFSIPILAETENSTQNNSQQNENQLKEQAELKTEAEIFSEALNDYNQQNFTLAEEKFNLLLADTDLDEGLKFSVLYYSTMTAVKKNQTNQAIEKLEEMNKLGFQSSRLNWEIAKLFLNKNNQFDSADFTEALKYLKKAQELGADSLDFKRDYAYAYLENKEVDKAEKLYKEISEKNAEDYLYLAQIKENKKEFEKAVEYYQAALDLNAKQSSLYLNLGNLYQELGKNNLAVNIFKEGINFKDDFAPYYIGLGESYFELEAYQLAKDVLIKAVEINQNSYYGYFLLGNIEKSMGNDNQALNYYSQALKYNPNYVEAFLAEGKIHLDREEYYRAISRFSLAVEENPEYAASHYYLAKAYYAAEMLEAARSEFRRTLHLDDSFKDARKILDKIEAELNIE